MAEIRSLTSTGEETDAFVRMLEQERYANHHPEDEKWTGAQTLFFIVVSSALLWGGIGALVWKITQYL